MNIIQKIQKAAEMNGLTLAVSGSKKTRTYFSAIDKPYKIISLGIGNSKLFESMCSYLIQNKPDVDFKQNGIDYIASFKEDGFKLVIYKRHGRQFICVYKA